MMVEVNSLWVAGCRESTRPPSIRTFKSVTVENFPVIFPNSLELFIKEICIASHKLCWVMEMGMNAFGSLLLVE
jgi:hypothetical protein